MAGQVVAQKGSDKLILLNGTLVWEGPGPNGGISQLPFNDLYKKPTQGLPTWYTIAYLVIVLTRAAYTSASSACGRKSVNSLLKSLVAAVLSQDQITIGIVAAALVQCYLKGLTIQPGSLLFVHNSEYVFVDAYGNQLPDPQSNPTPEPSSGFPAALDAGGYIITSLSTGGTTLIFDSQFNAIASRVATGRACCSDFQSKFYLWDAVNGGASTTLYQLSQTGTQLNSWTISRPGGQSERGIGVNATNTKVYYAFNKSTNGVVSVLDLVGGGTSTFVSLPGWTIWGANPSVITLRDGNILVSWENNDTTDTFVYLYDSSGAILKTFLVPGGEQCNALAAGATDNSTFWWSRLVGGITRIEEIRISDGAVLQGFSSSDSFFEGAEFIVIPKLIT